MSRQLLPLVRGLRNMIARSVIRLVDDAPQLQTLQAEATTGDLRDGVEHWHPYGFSAHPLPGSEGLLLNLGGSRAKPVVVAVADRRYRMRGLDGGEVAIHDDQGQSVHLTRTGIVVTGNTRIVGNVQITGTLHVLQSTALGGGGTVTGDLHVTGTATADTDVIGGGKSLKTHPHRDTQPGGGQSGPPA